MSVSGFRRGHGRFKRERKESNKEVKGSREGTGESNGRVYPI